MNICAPGILDLYFASIVDSIDEENEEINIAAPELTSSFLYEALKESKSWSYPKINYLPFHDVWGWMNNCKIPGTILAKNPFQKACFLLNQLCNQYDFNIEATLSLTRGFEAILLDDSESIQRLLKERISLILGVPKENKKWLSNLYNIRSRIIHGDLPVCRLGNESYLNLEEFLEDFEKPFLLGLSVYIALLQKMIIKKSFAVKFSEKVEYQIVNT
jgi:hypothetical protein